MPLEHTMATGCNSRGVTVYPSILLFCLLTFILCACNTGTDTKAIRFGLSSAPITLDPRYSTDATSSRINHLLYRQLVDFDSASRPVAALASWIKITPQHFRFQLKEKYRTFHDGSPLSAQDVKATFDSILDENNASPYRSTLKMIDHITVIDKDTVDFYLKYSDPLFPGYLEIGILPAKQITAGFSFNTQPLGSGPFRFVEWSSPERLRLERIRDRQIFEFITVKDQNTRVLKLMHGEIDMLQNDIDAELVEYLNQQKMVKVTTGKGSNFTYLGFNLTDNTVGQQQVREAIAYALDRQSIIRYMFAGRARLASSLLTPDHWAGDPSLAQYPYEPNEALKRLAALGYSPEKPLHIIYKTSNNPFRIRLATVIQNQLAKVGIQVELRTYDWGTFYGDIKAGNFQMFSLSWVGVNLPDIYRHVFYSKSIPPEGANRGRYSDVRVDKLLDRARTEQDMSIQAGLYRKIQDILHQTLPYVPLWYEDHVFIAGSLIKGYVIHTDGNYDGLTNVYRVNSSTDSKQEYQ